MSFKPVVPRERASRDVEQAVDFYVREAGRDVAARFVEALRTAYGSIGRRPSAGSPSYGHELNLPGLRSFRMGRFPYLVFYVERDDHIDVWRVLHERRDIPQALAL